MCIRDRYYADAPEIKQYTTDGYTKVIYEAITSYKPEIVLLGATHIGRDLGPCLAVKCNTGLTADCTKLEIDPETKGIMQTQMCIRDSWICMRTPPGIWRTVTSAAFPLI